MTTTSSSFGGLVEMEVDASSDEEWVFSSSSTQPQPQQQTKTKAAAQTKKPHAQAQQKLTNSAASICTIRANIPKSNRLPPFQPNLSSLPSQINKSLNTTGSSSKPDMIQQQINKIALPKVQQQQPQQQQHKIVLYKTQTPPPPSLQFISDQELQVMCTEMNSKLLVTRLIEVYKTSDIYYKIREIETRGGTDESMSIESRISDHLPYASNPCDFILNCLSALSIHFAENNKSPDLTSKFRRYLAHSFCTALARFLDTPLEKRILTSSRSTPIPQQNEQDLIIFDEQDGSEEEVDLISFDDVENQPAVQVTVVEDDDEEETESEDPSEEEEVITLAQILGVPEEIIDRYTLTQDHQIKLIRMIDTIPLPIIVYYAMDIFELVNIASFGCEFEDDGVKLCKALMKHGHYEETIACIRRLNLYPRFPTNTIADQFFTAGVGMSLPSLIQGQPTLQRELLSFINKQLRFNYAGNLDIVPREYLQDLINGSDKTQQLSRLKERKFQKDLVSCGAKILKDCDIPEKDYYFITLSQQYASLRFILAQRAIQQLEDGGDLSLEASSNFNGLIDLVCENDPVLARLAIKELTDTGDTTAPPHFASLYKQEAFYCRYQALPLNQRLLGIVKGEQMSRHRTMFTPKKASNNNGLGYYTLPPGVKWIMVNSHKTLMHLKDVLSTSNVCGIDTEWVPTFAKSGSIKTALMQIATDIDGRVFLLDLKIMFQPENAQLYRITEKILQLLFEDDQILKIAFDFSGDFNLLHSSIPSSRTWQVSKLVDLKSLKTMPTASFMQGQVITGGLAGVAQMFLGVTLNKRQQLSNWEKRPLTEEQALYGACDAYCLLDIYYTLVRLNHPFVKNITASTITMNTDSPAAACASSKY